MTAGLGRSPEAVAAYAKASHADQRVLAAAHENVERKSDYLHEEFQFDALLDEATDTLRYLAPPPTTDDSLRGSLWRAYERVRSGIRVPFTPASLRTSAGCAQHVFSDAAFRVSEWSLWCSLNSSP